MIEVIGKKNGVLRVLSGGSTGKPKEVFRSVESWSESVLRETSVFGLGADESYAVLGSPRHSLWAYVHFRALYQGSPCIGISKFHSRAITPLLESGATTLYSLPQLATHLLKVLKRSAQVIPSVRKLILGGSALPGAFPWGLQKEVLPNAEVLIFYGAAETSFIGYSKTGLAYLPFPDVRFDIRQDQLLWVKSPMTIHPDQWINTGDLARWSKEGLQIIGRSVRQISVQGEKFPVEPVEDVLEGIFHAEKMAILQTSNGDLVCVSLLTAQASSVGNDKERGLPVKTINTAINSNFKRFPAIKAAFALPANQWPVNDSGKTNWNALQRMVNGIAL